MIIHLAAAGVPVSWTIEALYRSSYGIAVHAAHGWYEQSIDGERDSPQCVVEMEATDGGWAAKRIDLWMGDRHLLRQKPDDAGWLVQAQSAPMPLPDGLATAIADALRARLIQTGYLIPRDEWERRYPAQALASRRFAEFDAAHDAWREANPGTKDQMSFEARWAPFMETPRGYQLPYSRGEDHVCVRRSGGKWSRIDPPELVAIDDVDAKVRLLNSGWTPAEVAVLLTDEPVG